MKVNHIPSVTKDSFQAMENGSKLNILYDVTVDIHQRVYSLEKRKRWDKAISLGGGIIGGFVAVISKGLWWK